MKLETLYLFSFSMILFKKYPLNSPINNGLIRSDYELRILFSPIFLSWKKSFHWTENIFFLSWKKQNKYYKILGKKIGENKIGRFVVWSDELVTSDQTTNYESCFHQCFSVEQIKNKYYKILGKKIGKNKIGRFLVWSDELVTTFKMICCCWFLALVCSLE